jgi:EmrB/QacA subfamily drug resistance transporter
MRHPRRPANLAPPGDSTGQRVALIAAATSGFLTPFMGSAVTIALPTMASELHLDAQSLGWVTSAFLLSAAALLLPFGRLADIVGRRRVFIAGLTLFAAATLLCATARSGGLLIAFRLLQGAGGALIFGTGTAIVTSVYPPARLGRALGITVASVYLGLSLGPFLGALLTAWLGWRGIFLVTAPLAGAAAALVAVYLEGEWAEAATEKFDLPGALVYGGALAALMVGLARVADVAGVALAALGILGLGVFLAWEARAPSPLLDLRLFRANPVFLYSNLSALINYSATFGVPFLLSLYLQVVRGLTVETAGTILVVQPVVQSVISPLAGWLSERVEPRIIASAGMGLVAAALGGLSVVAETAGLGALLALLGLLGFGFACFSSPNTNAVMGAVEPRVYGIASGVLGTMRLLGQMLSMALILLLFSLIMGDTHLTASLYAPFVRTARIAFGVFAALCAVGVLASLKRGDVRSPAHASPDPRGGRVGP